MENEPKCTLQTSVSIRGELRTETAWTKVIPVPSAPLDEPYVSLPSPSRVANSQRQQSNLRLLYRFPRLSFFLLFLVGCFTSGVFCSYHLTRWGLAAFDVPARLAVARADYEATGPAIRALSTCISEQSMASRLAQEQLLENQRKKAQRMLAANDAALTNLRVTADKCSSAVTNAILSGVGLGDAVVPPEAAECARNASLEVLQSNKDSDDALLNKLRSASQFQDSVSTQSEVTQLLKQLWQTADAASDSAKDEITAISTSSTSQLHSLATSIDATVNALIGPGSLLTLPAALHPEAASSVASSSQLAALQQLSALRNTLQAIMGIHTDLDKTVGTIEAGLSAVEEAITGLLANSSGLSRQVAYFANSTKRQVERTQSKMEGMLANASHTLTRNTVRLVEQWEAAEMQLTRSFEVEKRRHEGWFSDLQNASDRRSHAFLEHGGYSHTLPNTTEAVPSAIGNTSVAPSSAASSHTSSNAFSLDPLVLQASVNDLGRLFQSLVFWYDVTVSLLLLLDVGASLLTQSYTDMAPVDIRDMDGIQIITSIWDAMLCKVSGASMIFALATQGGELVRKAVSFLLLVLVGLVGTTLLFTWKRGHTASCSNTDPDNTNVDLTPEATWFEAAAMPFLRNSTGGDPYDRVQQLDSLTSSSSLKWKMLREEMAVKWATQSSIHEELAAKLEIPAAYALALQSCEFQQPNNTALLMDPAAVQQCVDSNAQASAPLPFPEAPNITTSMRDELNATHRRLSDVTSHCLLAHGAGQPTATTRQLEHRLACATESAVLLTILSWWLLLVVIYTSRFVTRMLIKAAALQWWRFLSGNRLAFVAFTSQDGQIQGSDALSDAIRDHLRALKWRVIVRMVAAIAALIVAVLLWPLLVGDFM